uniref:Uncharacterized protein n=2 Tax=Candidatus Kentrum sp. TUN TaxID=2126343 RepID=A0A451ALT5_9GAMM|nr:MAG: hypothetical protein BECKTUN1418E_GA0071001_112710 [Candidatus Kentron sp. TUN]
MSTSLLYHTWGIRGYTYIHTRYERGKTIFRIEQDAATLRSSCCGSAVGWAKAPSAVPISDNNKGSFFCRMGFAARAHQRAANRVPNRIGDGHGAKRLCPSYRD